MEIKARGHSVSSDKRKEYMGGTFQSAGRDDEKSCSNTYQIAPDKFNIIVDMSNSTNMSGNDNLWYQATCMAYLSEEVAATYVM